MQDLRLGETWIKRQFQFVNSQSKLLLLKLIFIIANRSYTIQIVDVCSRHSDTPAQLYEHLSHYINLLPKAEWYFQ